jgi:hypothetical protein
VITISAGSSVRLLGQLGVNLTGCDVRFTFEPVTPTTADDSGYVLALGGGGSQTREAIVVETAAGTVQYTLTAADTATPGTYRGLFEYDADGQQRVFPANGFIYFEVRDYLAPSVFSRVSDFCEPVRAILGDFRTPFQFEDAAIASVMRTVVRCGHLPGFAVTADGLALAPPVTGARDLALANYQSARMLLRPQVRGESWGTRALKIRRENQRDFLRELENLVYYAENPTGLLSFQTYYAWVNSLAGINVWGLMTEMRVNAPVATAIIGPGGIQMNTT